MLNKSVLYRDINSILNSTKCFHGSYAELHSYDCKGSQNKMEEFISLAKEHFGKDVIKYLLRDKVIFPNIDGGYDFNFGNAAFTGGIAYSNNKWHTVFYYDTKSWDDCYTIYHELAHVIQEDERLFDSETINNIFHKSYFERNFTDISKKKRYKRQYTHFLKETHAEVFAAACMLLRADNFIETVNYSRRIKARIGKSFLGGLANDKITYPSEKFYMDFDARLKIVKEANRWRINGKSADLIDKHGNINFYNLAEKAKEIVLNYTYSPEQFYAILNDNYDISLKFLKAKLFAALNPNWMNSGEKNEISRQLKRHKKINDDLWGRKFVLLPESDDEAAILNTVCQLDRAYNKLLYCSRKYSAEVSEYKNFNLEFCVNYGRVPDSVPVMYIDKFFQNDNKNEGRNIVANYQREVNNILFDSHADKNIVAKLVVQMRNEPSVRTVIWNMYRERQKDYNAKIKPQNFAADVPAISHKKQQKLELVAFDYLKNMIFKNFDNLSEEKAYAIRDKIIDLAATDPKKLENIDVSDLYRPYDSMSVKKEVKSCARYVASFVHIAYYIDEQTFTNVMKKYHSTFKKFNAQNKDNLPLCAIKTKNNGNCR